MVGRQIVLVCVLLGAEIHVLGGCGSSSRQSIHVTQQFGPGRVTPDVVNGMILAFADDHVVRISEAVDMLMADSSDLDKRARLNKNAVRNAHSTFVIATGPNPIVGMTDMVVMISLVREAIRRRAIDRTLTEEQRLLPESYDIDGEALEEILEREDRVMLRAFTASLRELRALAEPVLQEDQFEELDETIEAWWVENPDRRFVSHVRLKDFAAYRGSTVDTASERPGSLLSLLQLDPMAGMDPTTREIAQARMLADRLNFQLQRMPLLLSLTAKGLLYETLTTDELVSVRKRLEGTEASIARLVDAVDRAPQDVEVAILQIEEAVARQRGEFLRALEDRVGPLRDTLSELDSTLKTANVLSDSVTETVRSVDDLTTKMHERSAANEPTRGDPADVADYQRLVDAAVEGVGGIERSLSTIDRLLAPETIDGSPSRLQGSVAVATATTKDLVDHIFLRGIQIAVIVLVGVVIAAVLIMLIAARLLNRPRTEKPDAAR